MEDETNLLQETLGKMMETPLMMPIKLKVINDGIAERLKDDFEKQRYLKAQTEINYYNEWFGNTTIPKEQVCFMWNVGKIDGHLKITQILVAGFDCSLSDRDKEDIEHKKGPSERPQYLWDLFSFTCGYCDSDWAKRNLHQQIFRIINNYEFADHNVLRHFLEKEITKIKEINESFAKSVKEYKYY